MKRIKLLIFTLLLFCFIGSVNAGSASISAGAYTVTVGSNVKVTVSTNNLWGTYSISSSNGSVLAGGDSGDITLNSFSKDFYFTAKSVGSAVITFGPNATNMLADPDTGEFFNQYRTVTINVVNKTTPKQVDVNKTYDSNNYLKSLSVEGYEIPFDKDTLEYKLDLEPGTEKIKINANAESDTSSVKGAGEVSVSEGVNTLNIVVTAENGNERTYKIIATVEEKDPIEVTINKKKYRVVKKENLISDKDGYKKTTVKINEFDIPALYNEVTDVTLVALKDEEGNISLYSYDSKTGKYKEYVEYKFDSVSLYIFEDSKSKYTKTEIKINDINTIAYKLKGIDDYYLLYAINTQTGNEGYYLYDTKENTVQRYDTTMLETITKEKDKYLALIIVLSSVCFLSILFLLIEVNRYNKKKNS